MTLVVLVLALAAVLFVTAPKPERPFLFGAILPMTGAATSSGVAQEVGIMIAKDALEASTGARVAVSVTDSALVPEQGKTAANELVNAGASAIYSSYSVITREVSEAARVAETPLFYDSCNCGFAKENPYAFQLYVDPRKECREAALAFERRGATGAAFVGQDVPYAAYCTLELADVFGAARVRTELDQLDVKRSYAALFDGYKQEGIGFVVSLPITNHIVEAIRAAAQADLPFLCFAPQCLTPDIVSALSADERSAVTAFDFEVAPAFETKLRERVPDASRDLIVAAAVAHDALVYSYSAYEECGDVNAPCISANADAPIIDTAIVSRGFDADRILVYTTRYLRGDGEALDTLF